MDAGTRQPTDSMPLELYWVPGCTSCLRMKEFVTRAGLPFESVDLDATPEQAEKFVSAGLMVPVACKGGRCVNGLDLAAVAELAGISYDPPRMLAPRALRDRYLALLDVFDAQVRLLDDDALAYHLPGRAGPMSDVAYQVACVMRAFLAAYHRNVQDVTLYELPRPDLSAAEIAQWARATRAEFERWWDSDGFDDPLDRVVETYWGARTLHEILEREVWHTAQHLRQVEHVVDLFGGAPARRLTDEHLAGLPLPEAVHGG